MELGTMFAASYEASEQVEVFELPHDAPDEHSRQSYILFS